MSSHSSHRHRKGSKGSSNSSFVPNSTSWSQWSQYEWNTERKQWQSYRTNSQKEVEWRIQNDQSESSAAAGQCVPRDDSLSLATVSENTTHYSNDNNYTTGSNDVASSTNSFNAISLNSGLNPDPPIVANLEKHNTSLGHRDFDPNYTIHDGRDFKFGRVFKVLWSEPNGSAAGGTVISVRVKHGQHVHAKVRRFVIIDHRKGHCLCLPIMSYGGRATTKTGVHAEEHAIIHTTPDARLIPNEDGTLMVFPSVKIIPLSEQHYLDGASRINYRKVYTVEYNVKVWFTGYVDQGSESAVITSYNQANPPLGSSSQSSANNPYRRNASTYNGSSYFTQGIASNISGYPATSNDPTSSDYSNTASRSSYSGGAYSSTSSNSSTYGVYNNLRTNPPGQYATTQHSGFQYTAPGHSQPQYAPPRYPTSQYPSTITNNGQNYGSYNADHTYGSGSGRS